jgi:alginate O-acetyltransferase complex protein AlgI
MIFLTYEFVCFALVFYALYYIAVQPALRLAIVLIGGFLFQFYYGGWTSVVPVAVLAIVTFVAGRSGTRQAILIAVVLCVAVLAFYKYSSFVAVGIIGTIAPELGTSLQGIAKSTLPAVIPLGISFFTFEFVHYLVDVHRGMPPIRRPADFLAFALFWPTMVAGPIKRYQQFVPALHHGLAGPTAGDAVIGIARVAVGFTKKWAADNLTGWIEVVEPAFAMQTIG